MVFKQLLQAEAIDVCQIDSVRLAGVSEVLAVLLMAAKFGVLVCPHAGGVGLCEHVIHLRLVSLHRSIQCPAIPESLIDYIAVSGTMERNVLEFADHLHEHFVNPCTMNQHGRYNIPNDPKEGYRYVFKPQASSWSCIVYACCLTLCLHSGEMYTASIAEYEWPNGSYWLKRKAEGTFPKSAV